MQPGQKENWVLIQTINFTSFSTPTTLCKMYLSFVRPLLECGAELWNSYLQRDIKTIEQVQQLACKVILRGGNWNVSYHDNNDRATGYTSLTEAKNLP